MDTAEPEPSPGGNPAHPGVAPTAPEASEPEPAPPSPTAPPGPDPQMDEPEPSPADDACPGADKQEPGECGCDVPDDDSDGDGVADCRDACVDDPAKDAAGSCGCGTPDDDVDGDGTPDCLDECPEDADKIEPGECGCDRPDLPDDGDEDGTPDCVDECPDDANKSVMGDCGCGHPDTEGDSSTLCTALAAALVHRYDFAGTGQVAHDAVGDADAAVENTTLADGQLTLAGQDQYVDLPVGVLAGASDVTFEVWVTWQGSDAWQRIFDLGSNDGSSGAQGIGTSYVFLTPLSIGGPAGLRAAFKATGQAEVVVSVADPLPTAVGAVIAVVLSDGTDEMLLYRDGEELARAPLPHTVSDIDVVNAWLGRSQFAADPSFAGTIDEFRIYASALDAAQLRYSFEQGADPAYY